MEKLGLDEYMAYLSNYKRLFWLNFWAGVMRGLGSAVGFSILGAIVIIALNRLAMHNLPVIGEFLAEIVEYVQMRLPQR